MDWSRWDGIGTVTEKEDPSSLGLGYGVWVSGERSVYGIYLSIYLKRRSGSGLLVSYDLEEVIGSVLEWRNKTE